MSGKANISGLWMGRYSYAFGGAVPFLARIEDADGALSGTIDIDFSMGIATLFMSSPSLR